MSTTTVDRPGPLKFEGYERTYTLPLARAYLVSVLAILVILRLVLHFASEPMGDEAYYWLWGQHLAASYYDHPAANAWLLRAFSTLGWQPATLRLGGLLAAIGTLAIFADWARRLAGKDWADYLLAAAVIWLSSPLIFVFSTIAFSDYLLIFLSLASAHLFFLFFLGVEAGRPRYRLLYAAAFILGLAALAKYVAIFVGLAVAATILLRPKLRPLLRSPHLYAAALVAAGMQTPTLLWNADNGFVSFRFHFTRMKGTFGLSALADSAMFLIGGAAILSPPLVPALFRFLWPPRLASTSPADLWRLMGLCLFALSTGVFLYESIRMWVYVYWNILAFVLFFPLAPLFLKERALFAAHTLVGLAFATAITANYVLLPLAVLGGGNDTDSAASFGWGEIAAHTRAAVERLHPDFIAGADYQLAAQIGFALKDADVACVGPNCHQFDLWPVPTRTGGTALVLALDRPLEPAVTAAFVTLTPVETFSVTRFGFTLATYRLYLGTGFKADEARFAGTP